MSSTTDRRPEDGQILVLFAGAIVTLLLIAALVFDVGMMRVERRDQQNAADAAALAGARFVLEDENAARTAARRIALLNGFDDADPSEVVNIYIPPIHGRYAGFPGFIEVQIEGTRPSIFGGIAGRSTWPVGAYAVGVPTGHTSAEEIASIKSQISDSEETERPKVQFDVGETVKINDGPFLNFSGVIEEVDPDKGKLKVTVNIFGRNTPVELEYWQVEKA